MNGFTGDWVGNIKKHMDIGPTAQVTAVPGGLHESIKGRKWKKIRGEFTLSLKQIQYMKKSPLNAIANMLKLEIISIVCLFCFGCMEPRRDFCDCMDIIKGLTDGLTLSKTEIETKERGCKWIEEELSPFEIMQRTAQCYKTKSNAESNSTGDLTEHQIKQENIPPATNDTSTTRNDLEIAPSEQAITSAEANAIQSTQPDDELQFMFNFIHKKTKEDIDLLNNTTLRKRLQNLLGSRFADLQSIYDSSESSYIWIPYRSQPNEIDINIQDKNAPNDKSAKIVLDPKRNLINVIIRMNGRIDNFYENGMISEISELYKKIND